MKMSEQSESVFITGMGIISAIGIGVDETLISLRESKSGIGKINHIDTIHDLPSAEVSLTDNQMMEILNIEAGQIVTRTSLMAKIAVKEAITQAKLTLDGKFRVALINGTTVGGMEKSELYYFDFLENDKYNEYIEAHDCGSCTESIADYFGGISYVSTPSTACSSAANAFILGQNLINEGVVDIAIVGGSECLTKFHLNGFKTLMILDDKVCRPFDETRAGINLGEAAAFCVLEAKKTIDKRAVKPLAKLSGYGNACDAYHQTASSPEGNGAFIAMDMALKTSNLQPTDIDYINAHGTGTPNNDESEGRAVVRVFGDNPPHISSTKPLTGHTTSAAGCVEAVISILSLNNNFIPGNLNFSQQIKTLPFKPTEINIETEVNHVLSNSFGFGGNNTSLVFSKIESAT